MNLRWVPSPNWDQRRRGVVDAIVLHYTALPLTETIARFRDRGAKVSAHFIVDRKGCVVQMVKTHRRAWHAGPSALGDREDVNDFSIGIELVNWGLLRRKGSSLYVWKDGWSRLYSGEEPVKKGRDYWEPYTEEQYGALVELIRVLRAEYPGITRERVTGHSEVCLPQERKMDPGAAFDWERVLRGVFG